MRIKLFALAILLCGIHACITLQSGYAYGMDGYYYAAQIQSYWTKGRFFSRDASPVLYAMTLFSRLGTDIVVMNKIFTALLAGLFVFPAYIFSRHFLNERAALLATTIMASSAFAAMFKLTFVKNFAALIFLLLFLAMLMRDNKRMREWLLAVFLFLLTAFSHKLTAGLALVSLAYFAIIRRQKFVAGLLGGLCVLLICIASFLPNMLHWADFSRFSELFTLRPGFPPYEFSRAFSGLNFTVIEGYVFFAVSIVGVALFWRGNGFLALLAFLAANPFYNYHSEELGFRFFLLLLIPAGIFMGRILARFALPAMMGCLVYTVVSLQFMQNHDSIDYKTIEKITRDLHLPAQHLLMVHQGFDYYYCYKRKGDAFHFLPEEKHKDRPQFRMAYGLKEAHFKEGALVVNKSRIQRLSENYTLMDEKLWQEFIASANGTTRVSLLTWRNPHSHREAYMLRKQSVD